MVPDDYQVFKKTTWADELHNPFRWDIFVLSLAISGFATFIAALVMDNTLIQFYLIISPWRDAMWSAIFATICSFFVAPIIWKIGLVTFPQYLLAAMAVFVPLTVLSTLLMGLHYDIIISISKDIVDLPENQKWVLTAYIRLARSAVLIPVYLLVFWYVFHRVFKMKHRL